MTVGQEAPRRPDIPLERPDAPPHEQAPPFAAALGRILDPVDHLFDRAYGSSWNPFSRSGPVALALLLLVIATGVWLLLFYRIGTPYASVVVIQEQWWAGRWMRAFHRYASDLAVVFVVFHALRMMVQGRTWGPRVLAWVSGLIMTLAMFVCGWTGYVMVWDAHGYLVGLAGARLFDLLPFFASPIARTFSGDADVPASFFFLNLFLHMAIPLVMALIMWIHTSRLARSKWLPPRRLLWSMAAVILVLSIIVPAPLDPPADPFALGGRASYDWFYSFWVPGALAWSPATMWALVGGASMALLFVPLWWRPRRGRLPARSANNQEACTGCTQCVQDCPFEAISMVPRTIGKGSDVVAQVDPTRCVSCGLCAGSCDQLAIGPTYRGGQDQLRVARTVTQVEPADKIVFVHCARNALGTRIVEAPGGVAGRIIPMSVECIGGLHALGVKRLLDHFRGVFVLGCPEGRCTSREGVRLSVRRLFEGQDPADQIELDRQRLRILRGSPVDEDAARARLLDFADTPRDPAPPRLVTIGGGARRPRRVALAVAATVASLAAVAWLSRVEAGRVPDHSVVRLAWRLPGQSYRECRPLTPEEIASRPQHMRQTEECETVYLTYRLRVTLGGTIVVDRAIAPLGARGDRPLFVEHDIRTEPGTHALQVEFLPEQDPEGVGARLTFDSRVRTEAGRVLMLRLDKDAMQLETRGAALSRRPTVRGP